MRDLDQFGSRVVCTAPSPSEPPPEAFRLRGAAETHTVRRAAPAPRFRRDHSAHPSRASQRRPFARPASARRRGVRSARRAIVRPSARLSPPAVTLLPTRRDGRSDERELVRRAGHKEEEEQGARPPDANERLVRGETPTSAASIPRGRPLEDPPASVFEKDRAIAISRECVSLTPSLPPHLPPHSRRAGREEGEEGEEEGKGGAGKSSGREALGGGDGVAERLLLGRLRH